MLGPRAERAEIFWSATMILSRPGGYPVGLQWAIQWDPRGSKKRSQLGTAVCPEVEGPEVVKNYRSWGTSVGELLLAEHGHTHP